MTHDLTCMRPTSWAIKLSATLALAACSCTDSSQSIQVISRQDNGGTEISRRVDDGRHIALSFETGGTTYKAKLRYEPRDADGAQVFHVEQLTLARDGGPPMTWLWRQLPPDATLRFSDGALLRHPDPAVTAELTQHLTKAPPDLSAALDGLPQLLRAESRTTVYLAAVRRCLGAGDLDLLLAAIDEDGAMLADDAQGWSPEGPHSEGLGRCIEALAAHPACDAARADALAAHVTSIDISEHQATALCALVGHASTAALTEATDDVAASSARAKVLLAMAKARPLEQQDADRIATAAPSIGMSSLEADVLGALVGHASTAALTDAVDDVAGASARAKVLLAMAKTRPLEQPDADRIAAAAKSIGMSSLETSVLAALVPSASTAALLEASSQLSVSRSRLQLLQALAGKPDLSRADADLLVGALPSLSLSSDRAALLLALTTRASTERVREAAAELPSAGRAKVLDALLRRQGR